MPIRDFSRPQRGRRTTRVEYTMTRTSEPAVEPVTADELRAHMLATVGNLPDATADELIQTSRMLIEQMHGIAFITQTWTMEMDRWPQQVNDPWWEGERVGALSQLDGFDNRVDLPRYPVIAITGLSTYDSAGVETSHTVTDLFYIAEGRSRLVLRNGQTFPVVTQESEGIKFTFTAGYGASSVTVPAPLIQAIKRLSSYLHTHRGDCSADEAYTKSGARNLVRPYVRRALIQ